MEYSYFDFTMHVNNIKIDENKFLIYDQDIKELKIVIFGLDGTIFKIIEGNKEVIDFLIKYIKKLEV